MVQKNSVKPKILVIGGPTAVGKSDFAVLCAQHFYGEVVSADSMQIYKLMDIGTGKITNREMKGIKHHLIDFLEPNDEYSVGNYIVDAKKAINNILANNKLPIIVGGTSFYINALLNEMNLSNSVKDDSIRNKWNDIASKNGNIYVYECLRKIDEESANKINPNDIKRVIRALEIFEVTGKTKSQIATVSDCVYDYYFIVMSDERERLYRKIENRVDNMFKLGLEQEVKSLIQYRNCQSMQAIGYKQIIEYYDGKYATIDTTKDIIKKLSRNYAKRQLTFLRGMKALNKNFMQPNEFDNEMKNIQRFLDSQLN